jgi:lactate dehydrogenase-like 2-hydroxyacid dehydrogenase
LRSLPAADEHVRSGAWVSGQMPLGRKVTGRRFGIVGLGHIGSAIADRLRAFGPVHYSGPSRKDVDLPYHATLADLAQAVDVLILSSAANASTRHIVNADILTALGPAGYLVNIARGSLIDEDALIAALADGTIAGAALDVFEDEPNVPSALRESDKVILTPHIASATVETRQAMADLVLANLTAFAAGEDLPTAIV